MPFAAAAAAVSYPPGPAPIIVNIMSSVEIYQSQNFSFGCLAAIVSSGLPIGVQ